METPATVATVAIAFDISTKGSALFHRLKVSALKQLFTQYCTPEATNFCGGLPQPAIFPLQEVHCLQTDGISYDVINNQSLYLQYSRGDGVKELKEWIQTHTNQLHPPASSRPAHSTCISIGATDSVIKIFELLTGDTILFDQFAYNTTLAACEAIGKHRVGVANDEQGMLPSALQEQTLLARAAGLSPSAVYLVPIAQNPTGITMSLGRKQEIYTMCRTLDLVIIEDDAYYYLYLGEDEVPGDYSLEALPGTTRLPQSLLSMDTDGRVIRIDTISKFIAPGFRLGWISGPESFVFKYQVFQECSGQFPSGLSQSVFLQMVKAWGVAGLDHHVRLMQRHYKQQRDAMYEALAAGLSRYMSSSSPQVQLLRPSGGMFMWLVIHDAAITTSEQLFLLLAELKVITVPGSDFFVRSLNEDAGKGGGGVLATMAGAAVRLSFALSSREQIVSGAASIVNKLKEVLG